MDEYNFGGELLFILWNIKLTLNLAGILNLEMFNKCLRTVYILLFNENVKWQIQHDQKKPCLFPQCKL